MKTDHLRPVEEETEKVVNDEYVEGLQKERLASHRRAVESFTLLVAQSPLNYVDTKLRAFWSYLVIRIFQIPEKPVNTLLSLKVGHDAAVPDAFGIFKGNLPMLAVNSLQLLSALPPGRCLSPLPVFRRSSSCRPME